MTRFSYLEPFCGAWLVRAGLGESWRCCFAIDDDPAKRRAYSLNYGLSEFRLGDVASLALTDLRSEGEDDIAGCLRVATGGSLRQSWLRIEDGRIRRRVMTGREAARLMGLPDAFRPPRNENEALTAIGDGVAVLVVRFLTAHLLEPLLGERGR